MANAGIGMLLSLGANAALNDTLAPSPEASEPCDFLDDMCLSNLAEGAPVWTFILELVLFAYGFIGLAIVCDDYLVLALERICEEFQIREDVAGATFMAFGSAAPEIVINAVTTIKQASAEEDDAGDEPSIGVGAIIGSGIIAFLLIPAICALSVENDIKLILKRRPLFRDVITYATSLLLLCIFFADGRIVTWEAGILVGLFVIYVMVVVSSPKIRRVFRVKVLGKKQKARTNFIEQAREKRKTLLAQSATRSDEAPSDNTGGESLIDSDENSLAARVVNNSADLTTEEEDIDAADELAKRSASMSNYSMMMDAENPSANGAQNMEEEDEKGTCIGNFIWKIAYPLRFLFEWTCINCEHDGQYAKWYPVTFLVAFIWVSSFSFIIGTVAQRWAYVFKDLSGINIGGEWFGLVVVSIGAEIPDAVSSMTVARRGYGSMAVSNAIGSQIINILIGLGLPWFMSNLGGTCIRLFAHRNLEVAAFFQFGIVFTFLCLLLGVALVMGQNKAMLTRPKAKFLMTAYVVVIITYTLVQVFNRKPDAPKDLKCPY